VSYASGLTIPPDSSSAGGGAAGGETAYRDEFDRVEAAGSWGTGFATWQIAPNTALAAPRLSVNGTEARVSVEPTGDPTSPIMSVHIPDMPDPALTPIDIYCSWHVPWAGAGDNYQIDVQIGTLGTLLNFGPPGTIDSYAGGSFSADFDGSGADLYAFHMAPYPNEDNYYDDNISGSPSVPWRMRVQLSHDGVRVKAWRLSEEEPTGWMVFDLSSVSLAAGDWRPEYLTVYPLFSSGDLAAGRYFAIDDVQVEWIELPTLGSGGGGGDLQEAYGTGW
jgi:hypothetical protein